MEIEDVLDGRISVGELQVDGDHLKWELDAGMVDWCLDDFVTTELRKPGWVYFGGVTVDYVRGDGWTTDDDAEYDVREVRAATADDMIRFGFSPSQLDPDGL
jgi:hypothetical protein